MTSDTRARIPRHAEVESPTPLPICGYSDTRSASTPYVSGLARMIHAIQREAPFTGNSEPESIHSGIRKRLMIAWKACVESRRQATTNPKAVREKETSKIESAAAANRNNVKWI